MAPRKRQRCGEAAAAGLANAAVMIPAPDAPTGMPAVNAEHYALVERNVQVILNHPVFEGIQGASPIAINAEGESGYKASGGDAVTAAMQNVANYSRACRARRFRSFCFGFSFKLGV